MVGRRKMLLATAGVVTLSGCSSTGGGEGDTSISSPSCSSSSHFKLVESSYDPIPESRIKIGVELLAFENIGNQPVYDVNVRIRYDDIIKPTYTAPQKWDAGTRFQVTDMGEVSPDATIIVSGSLPSGETVSEEACI